MSPWAFIGFVGLAGLGAAYLALFLCCGREYRTPGLGRYLADPDELGLPPALVGYVWRMGHLSSHDISATILDLIDRRLIDLDDPMKPGSLILRSHDVGALMPHERALVSLLEDLSEDGRVSIAALDHFSRRHPQLFMDRMFEFKEAIVSWACKQGVFESESEKSANIARGIGWLTGIWTPVAVVLAKNLWLLLGVPLSILMWVFATTMWRRSQEFADVRNKAEALHRYLKDFGRMGEKPAAAVILWSRYLVFAEEFGMAGHVRAQLLQQTGEHMGGVFSSLTFVLDILPVLPQLSPSPEEDDLVYTPPLERS